MLDADDAFAAPETVQAGFFETSSAEAAQKLVDSDGVDLDFVLGRGAMSTKGWDGCPIYRTDRVNPMMASALYFNTIFRDAADSTVGITAVGMTRGDDGFEERLAIEDTCGHSSASLI